MTRGAGGVTETAPAVFETAGAVTAVPVDFVVDFVVTFLLDAGFVVAGAVFAELFFDAVAPALAVALVEVACEVLGLFEAELGRTFTWLFFLPRPSSP